MANSLPGLQHAACYGLILAALGLMNSWVLKESLEPAVRLLNLCCCWSQDSGSILCQQYQKLRNLEVQISQNGAEREGGNVCTQGEGSVELLGRLFACCRSQV